MGLLSIRSAQLSLRCRSSAVSSMRFAVKQTTRSNSVQAEASTQSPQQSSFQNRTQAIPLPRADQRLRKDASLQIKQSSKLPIVIGKPLEKPTSKPPFRSDTIAGQPAADEQEKNRKRIQSRVRQAMRSGQKEVATDPARAVNQKLKRTQVSTGVSQGKGRNMANAVQVKKPGSSAKAAPTPGAPATSIASGSLAQQDAGESSKAASALKPKPKAANNLGTNGNLSRKGRASWIEDPQPWRGGQQALHRSTRDSEKSVAARLKRQLDKAERWAEVSKLRMQLIDDRTAAFDQPSHLTSDNLTTLADRLTEATEAAEVLDVQDEASDVEEGLIEEAMGRETDGVEEGEESLEEVEEPPKMRAKKSRVHLVTGSLSSESIQVDEIPPLRAAPVATLGRGLQRVLFNPSVHYLSDPRTSVFNFEEDLAQIPAVDEFAYDRCPQYITASKDSELLEMSEHYDTKYFGSTSTLTKALSQIYFAISGGKPVTFHNLSQEFSKSRADFTAGAKLPACLVVKALPGGKYAVDNDKRLDVDENVLSDMGRVLEKMLTTEASDFKRFLKSSPDSAVSAEERNAREAYRYSKISKTLMRSQLDCFDPRLPGTGTFDIKTRACLPIRHDRANYLENAAYDISRTHGLDCSFEREYYDLIRSGMLKYSLQARIGNMDGIFVAYHNTRRMFGFQYLPLEEIDARLFGSSEMGDAAYKLSVTIFESILDQATKEFPETSLTLTIDDSSFGAERRLTAWASPEVWDKTKSAEQPIVAFFVKLDNELNGEPVLGHMTFPDNEAERIGANWTINYEIFKSSPTADAERAARNTLRSSLQRVISMQNLTVPEGKTVEEMIDRDQLQRKIEATEAEIVTPPLGKEEIDAVAKESEGQSFASVKWKEADSRIQDLRAAALRSGREYEERAESIARERGYARPPLPSAHYTSEQAVMASKRMAQVEKE